ncbi:hypothetical protein TIFTF001_032021 [Ficus carica]|uniref:R13L1/DRL21-like LRR repeat region domain-containing protein n=1 Tax=Ficus carica TaxID=3494 RepID=A0AA88DVY9_FICCA|nr:hypothetical protein TIFTF001_032021 [Ficus carica]
MFVVPHHENNEALKLEDLTSLVELDWHFIHVLGCFNLQNAESEQLRGKENLANLNLTFYSRNGRDGNEILEALQPHENLKSLEIREVVEFHRLTKSNWMSDPPNCRTQVTSSTLAVSSGS